MKNIEDEWESFETKVISKNAPKIQRSEMKLAFYAGTVACIEMCASIENEKESEVVENMMTNINDFVQKSVQKYEKSNK